MIKLNLLFGTLALCVVLAQPSWVLACPSCADAPAASSGTDDENVVSNQMAYNHSIYVMVGVPYLTLGIGTFLVYRGMKKNEAFRRAHAESADAAAATSEAIVAAQK